MKFAENYLDFRNVLENQKGNLYIFTNFSEVCFFLQYMHNVKSCNYGKSVQTIDMRTITLNLATIHDISSKHRLLHHADSEVSIKKWTDGMAMNFKGISA